MAEKVSKAMLGNKYLFHLAMGLLLLTLVGFASLRYLFAIKSSLYWLVSLPFFFFAMGYGMRRALQAISAERYLVNVYLILKITKILCLVAIALVYIFVFHVAFSLFLPIFFSFYLLYLIWETRFLFRYEKNLKTEML
jgi:hypothetical protein